MIAQRLVRRICKDCKRPVTELVDRVRQYLEAHGAPTDQLYQGAGCDRCRHTGYRGRVGIYELLEIDEDMRNLIAANPSLGDLRRYTQERGTRTLLEDGLLRVAKGVTTVEEIMRVTEL